MGEQRIKTILMDCDGVLVDSEMIYLTSLVHYLKLLGIDTTIDDLAYLVGSDIESITEKVRRQFGLEQYSVQELIDGQRRQFNEDFQWRISANPGADCISGRNEQAGYRTGGRVFVKHIVCGTNCKPSRAWEVF